MENHLFWGQKIKGQGRETQWYCRCGPLSSCECWVLASSSAACIR